VVPDAVVLRVPDIKVPDMPSFLMPKLDMPKTDVPSPQNSTSQRRCCCRFQSSRSRMQPPSLTCLRSTSCCSWCQNSTYPTCPHLCSQGGRAKIRSPRHAKIRHARRTTCGVQPHVPKFKGPMKLSSPAAIVADENLEPQEVRSTLHMSVIEVECSLKCFTVSTQV
jgi:hypothetical protein